MDVSKLKNFTRRETFECSIPRTKVYASYDMVRSHDNMLITDPCTQPYIPPFSTLLKWQSEIQQLLTSDPTSYHYVEFYYTGVVARFDLCHVKHAQTLHSVRDVKERVEQEVNFLSSTKMVPRCIGKTMDVDALRTFKNYIHNTEHFAMIDEYGMQPGELFRLCGKQYLSDEHMIWVSTYLNSIQNDTLCIYANFINDIEGFCRRREKKNTHFSFL